MFLQFQLMFLFLELCQFPIKYLNLNKRYSAVIYFIKSLFQFISVAYPITKYGFKRCLTHLGKELVEEDCPTQDASLRTLTYKKHTYTFYSCSFGMTILPSTCKCIFHYL